MPSLRTEITEITTGLAMLGYPTLERALAARPATLLNVESAHYDRLDAAYASGDHAGVFDVAWHNGTLFARSADGLRGRPPWWLEWKGNHRPPGYDQIPADLRVDHVYLVSCKYGSTILTNSSPANLFDRLLADRKDETSEWYLEVAPDAYQDFYAACVEGFALDDLPDRVAELEPAHRRILKERIPRSFPGSLEQAYEDFAHHVARISASRWRRAMGGRRGQEAMLWRMLRLQSAPYFVLGQSAEGHPMAYRVGTPWDFRNSFAFVALEVMEDRARRQPVVRWIARVRDRSGTSREVEGHVEVRWSHGRFAQAPEAKVYLDTPHHLVPGYFPIDAPPPNTGQLGLELA